MFDLFSNTSLLRCLLVIGLNWCAPVIAASDVCVKHQCVAVVDAGSTGSRLHVYAYDTDENHQPVHIFEHYAHRVNPGLASLTLDQKIINKYLEELFSVSFGHRIPVYVYATAGMRLLSIVDQEKYYDALRNWFSYQSQLDLEDARTISGTEEGVFAWLAVNLPVGALNSEFPTYTGVMDVGGASTQVVFAVKNSQDIAPEDLVEFDLYGKHISLFSHSFLGLGIREVSKRFHLQPLCWTMGYVSSDAATVGQGDANLCQSSVSDEINTIYDIQRIVRPAQLNNPSDSWTVLGAVSAMLKTFNGTTNDLDLQTLLQKTDELRCRAIWPDLVAQYPEDKDLSSSCLLGSYYYALTVNGYGLAPEQKIHYNSSNQETDWTLGVVLHLH